MDASTRLRVLIAQVGPGGDDGADPEAAGRFARALRDAGHEVVYLGVVPDRDVLAAVALQEDVDATCLVDGGRWVLDGDEDAVRHLRDLQ
ncbi:MAG: hypothetical protein LT071_00160 [Nocardioides sp.]|nr:hypothetical protein [Nocardioides sp.]